MSLRTFIRRTLGLKASAKPWVTYSCVEWLLAEDYVERPSRGLYSLTEKGRQLSRLLR